MKSACILDKGSHRGDLPSSNGPTAKCRSPSRCHQSCITLRQSKASVTARQQQIDEIPRRIPSQVHNHPTKQDPLKTTAGGSSTHPNRGQSALPCTFMNAMTSIREALHTNLGMSLLPAYLSIQCPLAVCCACASNKAHQCAHARVAEYRLHTHSPASDPAASPHVSPLQSSAVQQPGQHTATCGCRP